MKLEKRKTTPRKFQHFFRLLIIFYKNAINIVKSVLAI